jgi:hypothetical protein
MARFGAIYLLTFAGCAAAWSQMAAERTVYILPMAGGLDQYLAEQITRGHVMRVVADPKTADLVLTDRLGEGFEERMARIHPRTDEKAPDATSIHREFRTGRIGGTVFLVDAASRQVVWSDYEKPTRNLQREASRIAKKLALWVSWLE